MSTLTSKIQRGYQICICISKGVLWLEKGEEPENGTHPPVPQPVDLNPREYLADTRPRIRVAELLKDKTDDDARTAALYVALLTAWTAGLHVADNTERYLQKGPEDILVFQIV